MSPAAVPAASQADASVAIVRRLMQEGFSEGSLDVIGELISPGCVEHQRGTGPASPGPSGSSPRCTAGLPASASRSKTWSRTATPWIRNRATGTSTGRFPGSEPTGKPIDITVSGVVRTEDGRAAGHWGVADQLGVALQLGLFGPAGQPGH